MARCEVKPSAPPLNPSEGGTYLLEGGELKCIQQTAPPAVMVAAASDSEPED